MKKAFICHPFQNDKDNLLQTKKFCLMAMMEHYNPISPAVYYSQFLNDGDEKERKIGRELGLDLIEFCDELWICGDVITKGMKAEINEAYRINKTQCEILIRQVDMK